MEDWSYNASHNHTMVKFFAKYIEKGSLLELIQEKLVTRILHQKTIEGHFVLGWGNKSYHSVDPIPRSKVLLVLKC